MANKVCNAIVNLLSFRLCVENKINKDVRVQFVRRSERGEDPQKLIEELDILDAVS